MCSHADAKILIDARDGMRWCDACGSAWFDGEWHWPRARPTTVAGGVIPQSPPAEQRVTIIGGLNPINWMRGF